MDPNQNQPDTNSTLPQPQAGASVPPVQNPMGGAPTTPPPAPPSPPTQNPESAGESKPNGKIILFIIVGVLLLIILGAIYFMAQQLNSSRKESITPTPTQVPTPTSTPTPTPLSEEDIDIIDLGDPEADLKSIDDDVGQL